ncbi:MAG: hypothetical protein K1X33_03945 [Methanobacteriaceae archaeon]|nr:hypothetical protein [Methanobacteriaceae archaeon]
MYNTYIVNNILHFGYHISFKLVDRGIIELIGPLGITRGLSVIIKRVSNLQTGLIYHYALMIILGITFFVLLFTLPFYFKTGLLLVYFYFFFYFNNNNNI